MKISDMTKAQARNSVLSGLLRQKPSPTLREDWALAYERDALAFEEVGDYEWAAEYRQQAHNIRTVPDWCCIQAIPGVCPHGTEPLVR